VTLDNLNTQKGKRIMATKKKDNNQLSATLQRRIGVLTDRITILENNLKSTQDLIQKDMKRIIEMVRNR
tara:strand:- start:3307 stop:3513 length:207 start_codon:yes stop_codon:yes gene_type:complete